MTVQDDAVRTVTVPSQAAPPVVPATPAAPPAPAATPAPAPLLGRDRPLTTEERHFALAAAAMLVILGSIIVVGLLVAQYVWT